MKLALLGDPVEHSRSPAIHNAALAAVGVKGSYEARRVDRAGLATAVAEIRYGSLDGANVTMPHKETAFTMVDRVSERGLRAGALNTITHRLGNAHGDDTDIPGLLAVWDQAGLPAEAPVLILGSGGTAAGAVVAFEGHPITIAARTPDAARSLLHRTRVVGSVIDWGIAVDGSVVVNATPLGMDGEPLPEGIIESAAGLIDLPCAETVTPAVAAAAARGLPVADGREVLIAQAAASFELWTGVPAPIDVMRAAAAVR